MIYMYVHRRQLRIFTFTNLSFWMPLCLHISQVLSLPCVSVNIHFVITSPEHFVHAFFISNQEWYVFCFTNVRNSSAWGRNYKIRPQARSFDEGPLPPLSTQVDTDVIHVIKHTRPSLSVFAYCKRSKTGRWVGLGTRLGLNISCQTFWIQKLQSDGRNACHMT